MQIHLSNLQRDHKAILNTYLDTHSNFQRSQNAEKIMTIYRTNFGGEINNIVTKSIISIFGCMHQSVITAEIECRV